MSDHRKITLALLREHGEFIKASTHGEKWRVPVTGGVILTVPADGHTPKGSGRWKYAAEEVQRVLRRYRLSYEQLEEDLARIEATADAEAVPAVTTPTRAPLPAWGPPGWHDRAKREKETVDVRATEDTSDDETRATDAADDAGDDGGDELQPDPAATPHQFVKSTARSEGGLFLCSVCRQTTKHRAHTTWKARQQAASPVAAVSDGEDVVLPCPHCSGSGSLTVPLADLRDFLLKRGR